ncbi:hypothetical protein MNV49_002829 [Pseudohyphozyma bogoriensis]|nr:hypothetical protein MNV49_002829 [Pseudohyphozyma bogoriensis]
MLLHYVLLLPCLLCTTLAVEAPQLAERAIDRGVAVNAPPSPPPAPPLDLLVISPSLPPSTNSKQKKQKHKEKPSRPPKFDPKLSSSAAKACESEEASPSVVKPSDNKGLLLVVSVEGLREGDLAKLEKKVGKVKEVEVEGDKLAVSEVELVDRLVSGEKCQGEMLVCLELGRKDGLRGILDKDTRLHVLLQEADHVLITSLNQTSLAQLDSIRYGDFSSDLPDDSVPLDSQKPLQLEAVAEGPFHHPNHELPWSPPTIPDPPTDVLGIALWVVIGVAVLVEFKRKTQRGGRRDQAVKQ